MDVARASRWKKHRKSLAITFWDRVDKSGGPDACWPWLGRKTPDGYGRLTIQGREAQAHRVAYTLAVGAVPAEYLIRHNCDNPPCCNPAHLSPGTHLDNMRDRNERGRVGRPKAKLTPEQVASIRARLAESKGKHSDAYKKIAAEYGVTYDAVYRLHKGKTWPERKNHSRPSYTTAGDGKGGTDGR